MATDTERVTMTKAEKRAAIDAAWKAYRAASIALPRTLPYAGFKRAGVFREGWLEKDEALWRRYLATEQTIARIAEKVAA